MAQAIAFIEKIVNSDQLMMKHASGNYKFSPNINGDDLVFHLLCIGKRKFDVESMTKVFENNTYGVLEAIRSLSEQGILTQLDENNWQFDTAKVLKKEGDKLKFIYPSKIKA